jgi:hypothetical protein
LSLFFAVHLWQSQILCLKATAAPAVRQQVHLLYANSCTCCTPTGTPAVRQQLHLLYANSCTCCTPTGAPAVRQQLHLLYANSSVLLVQCIWYSTRLTINPLNENWFLHVPMNNFIPITIHVSF